MSSTASSPPLPSAPIPPPPELAQATKVNNPKDFARFAHYAALGCLVAVPLIIALPPRKLDIYTFTLLTCGVISTNHLVYERYNKGLLVLTGEKLGFAQAPPQTLPGDTEHGVAAAIHRAEARADSLLTRFDLPTQKSRDIHAHHVEAEHATRLRDVGREHLAERARRLRDAEWGYGGDMARMLAIAEQSAHDDLEHDQATPGAEGLEGFGSSQRGEMEQEQEQEQGHVRDERGVKGLAKRAWYGDEDPARWKEQRMREEREALEEGRGYGSMIVEQIWEVWNWDKRKNEDGDWVPKEEVEGRK